MLQDEALKTSRLLSLGSTQLGSKERRASNWGFQVFKDPSHGIKLFLKFCTFLWNKILSFD